MHKNKQTGAAEFLEIEPELAQFQRAIRAHIDRSLMDNPPIEAFRAASRAARLGWSLAGPEVPMVATPDFGLPARHYQPVNAQNALIIYLHGGGWSLLDIDTHDRLMREYALQTGWHVLGLDYPLAPEVRFPQNLLACAAAITRVIQNAEHLGVRPDRIVLAGDSSGANLAMAIALRGLKDGRTLAGLVLNYGVYDSDLSRDSYIRHGQIPNSLSTELMAFFWQNYCESMRDRTNTLAAPLRATPDKLAKLPPVHMTIAGQDVLLDENLLMAKKLKAAGVEVSHKTYPTATHGFLEAVGLSPVADLALADTARWIKRL